MYAINKVKRDLIKIRHGPVKHHKYEITLIKTANLPYKICFLILKHKHTSISNVI
jgi:hypothetical protein